MSDVEGVRNLIGTGLVEFLGGLLTAVIALVMLPAHQSGDDRSGVRAASREHGRFCGRRSACCVRSFASRSKINAEVSGRLTESLSGVRVVKGLPCGVARARCVYQGRATSARQCAALADHHVDDEFFQRQRWAAWLAHLVYACWCASGAGRKNHSWPVHELYGVFWRFMIAPVFQGRRHRHAN